ncbi:hypothetical protein SPRG_03430 [Saprolegnia parasitica CBS 223.65]|uniref:Uncharacterized protein n=1 Tax=Saprolegnia parasitica (strain CBS 223.65) TaxID=695850 RepID=A0A067CNH2_SAPPC|nr:hypothetical protein SPRG_03430 [Saprolegnia parasitica CBS 223.65]KDO32214.1 hypothetical protein SPRG_03430 [Saprolegnia parasitica CBS 223.65]|eukprot:XP_012197391.1 hypothetical protein SPRG_03430 [Saprolegnia parasitica CBS 223.65]
MDVELIVCIANAVAITVVFSKLDGRSFRALPMNRYTFGCHLRCTRFVFECICMNIVSAWPLAHPPLRRHNMMDINDRVTVTLHYLTHYDGYESTGVLFAIAKTRVVECCNQIFVVVALLASDTVALSSTHAVWEEVR